jgi:hypothetical protein
MADSPEGIKKETEFTGKIASEYKMENDIVNDLVYKDPATALHVQHSKQSGIGVTRVSAPAHHRMAQGQRAALDEDPSPRLGVLPLDGDR